MDRVLRGAGHLPVQRLSWQSVLTYNCSHSNFFRWPVCSSIQKLLLAQGPITGPLKGPRVEGLTTGLIGLVPTRQGGPASGGLLNSREPLNSRDPLNSGDLLY
jgi:hypothetical protein